jgi:hypothetical protein
MGPAENLRRRRLGLLGQNLGAQVIGTVRLIDEAQDDLVAPTARHVPVVWYTSCIGCGRCCFLSSGPSEPGWISRNTFTKHYIDLIKYVIASIDFNEIWLCIVC